MDKGAEMNLPQSIGSSLVLPAAPFVTSRQAKELLAKVNLSCEAKRGFYDPQGEKQNLIVTAQSEFNCATNSPVFGRVPAIRLS
jgi:hypothetical protein